jgi:NitT/TauT family transport system ATP-binding protein
MQKIGKVKCRKMAEDIIHAVGLSHFINHYPHQLSGGMRQRAAIAQALVTEPALLLMDEPFGALDDFTRTELQELLLEIHDKKHITTIFVTHSIDEALKLGDRILLFSKRPAKILEDIRIGDRTNSQHIDNLHIQLRQQLHSQFN